MERHEIIAVVRGTINWHISICCQETRITVNHVGMERSRRMGREGEEEEEKKGEEKQKKKKEEEEEKEKEKEVIEGEKKKKEKKKKKKKKEEKEEKRKKEGEGEEEEEEEKEKTSHVGVALDAPDVMSPCVVQTAGVTATSASYATNPAPLSTSMSLTLDSVVGGVVWCGVVWCGVVWWVWCRVV